MHELFLAHWLQQQACGWRRTVCTADAANPAAQPASCHRSPARLSARSPLLPQSAPLKPSGDYHSGWHIKPGHFKDIAGRDTSLGQLAIPAVAIENWSAAATTPQEWVFHKRLQRSAPAPVASQDCLFRERIRHRPKSTYPEQFGQTA